jgi:hypothetical protein
MKFDRSSHEARYGGAKKGKTTRYGGKYNKKTKQVRCGELGVRIFKATT